jgi:hypothetical protein
LSCSGKVAPRGCIRDGGRPSGAVIQVKVPNRLKLLWSKAMVVSVEEKAYKIRQVWIKKVNIKLTSVSVENARTVSELGSLYCPKINLGDTCLLLGRHPA